MQARYTPVTYPSPSSFSSLPPAVIVIPSNKGFHKRFVHVKSPAKMKYGLWCDCVEKLRWPCHLSSEMSNSVSPKWARRKAFNRRQYLNKIITLTNMLLLEQFGKVEAAYAGKCCYLYCPFSRSANFQIEEADRSTDSGQQSWFNSWCLRDYVRLVHDVRSCLPGKCIKNEREKSTVWIPFNS